MEYEDQFTKLLGDASDIEITQIKRDSIGDRYELKISAIKGFPRMRSEVTVWINKKLLLKIVNEVWHDDISKMELIRQL